MTHKTFTMLVAEENARRVLADPSLLDIARDHIARRRPDLNAGADQWLSLLDQGPDAVAAALTTPGPKGDYLRETAPSFGALPASLRARLVAVRRAQGAP